MVSVTKWQNSLIIRYFGVTESGQKVDRNSILLQNVFIVISSKCYTNFFNVHNFLKRGQKVDRKCNRLCPRKFVPFTATYA